MYINKKSFDTVKYNFAESLCQIFNVSNLSTIKNDIEVLKRENDQSTPHHKLFYEWMETQSFRDLYDSFIKEYVRPLYSDKIVVQKRPTFRICYPNNIAVGEFHKDKWYRDGDWAVQVKELNFFLPFTEAFDTNTIWVESEEDKKDFAPMNCKYGEFIQWDGPNLLHGNYINQTGSTRISVDFRVIEYNNYIPSDKGSINANKKFKLGEYYDLYD
jgi:hypothetical protein